MSEMKKTKQMIDQRKRLDDLERRQKVDENLRLIRAAGGFFVMVIVLLLVM